MADRNLVLQLIITLRDQAREGIDRIGAGIGGIRNAVSAALEPLRTFGGLMAAAIGVGGAKELIDRADAYTRLTNALKVATKTEQEYQAAKAEVDRLAAATRSDLETTASLYARVSQNRKSLNVSEREAADLTELISKGMQLGGASTQEYASAVLQLTQAFGSGVLRGEEFNSVMETSPQLMQRLADGLGVAIGELRGLAEQGVLTSSTVARALLSQKEAIDSAYSETITTAAQSMQQLSNEATNFIGRLNEQLGATRGLGAGLQFLAENLSTVASLMGAGLAASVAKGTVALTQSVQASLAARTAARDLAIAEAARQRETLANAQTQVAAAQAAYNRALAEQRLAQQIVTSMQAELGYGVTEADLAAARAQGATAAQAATAATQRYTAAQAALNALQVPAAAGAGIFARALGFLAGPGGLILTAVASFSLLYSAFARQKQPTDDLTQSTEDYAEALKKLSTAQTGVELDRINQQIAEQKQRVAEAAAAYAQAANNERAWIVVTEDRGAILGKTNRVVSDANEIERIRTARQAELDAATQALAATEERRAAALESLNNKQRQQAEGAAQQAVQYMQQGLAAERLGSYVETLAKHQDVLAKAEQDRLQGAIKLAQVAGDLQRADALSVDLAVKRADAAKKQADLDHAAAAAAKAKVEALEGEYATYQALSPVQQAALDTARRTAAEKGAQATASLALADALREEARSEQLGVAAKERAAARAEQTASAIKNQTSAIEAAARAQLDGIRADIDKANALGQTTIAQQKTIELAKAEAEWARVVAAAKQAEIAAQIASNQAKMAAILAMETKTVASTKEYIALGLQNKALSLESEALQKGVAAKEAAAKATGNATQATQANTAATAENAAATDQAAESAGSLAGVIASLIDYWRQKTAALSESTKALFEYNAGLSKIDPSAGEESLGGISEEAAKAGAKLGELTAFIRQMDSQMLNSTGSVGRYMDMIQRAGAMAERSYYEQKLQAEQLETQLAKVGETGGRSFASVAAAMSYVTGTAATAKDALYLLNEQDMDQLQAAIDGANNKLREMQEEAQSARDKLAELDAQIAEARGDKDRADRLKLELEQQKALAEVEKQLAEARAMGEQNLIALYEEQKRKLQELYDLKERNLEQEQRGGRQSGGGSNTTTTTSSTPSGGGGSGGSGGGGSGSGGVTQVTNNIYADITNLANEEWVRRNIIPTLDKVARLRR